MASPKIEFVTAAIAVAACAVQVIAAQAIVSDADLHRAVADMRCPQATVTVEPLMWGPKS